MIEEYVSKLTKLMKKKYEKMVEIENITKDIEEALKRNDKVSTDMFMKMRLEVMTEVDGIDGEIYEIIQGGDENQYHYLRNLIRVETQQQAMDTEFEDEKMLMLVSLRVRNVLKNIIEKDKIMNQRLLGKDSFYAKK
ncbi:MAG TPA: hypothetical protein IAB62_06180 [Candidatus Coprocola pullicola]|nr:hypothetical protein [Candidatus Coprocola pullicola]